MAKLLFRLNQVEEDEANEVRELLEQHGYDYYETSAGRWGVSVAAIWLRHEEDYEAARALLDDYQQQRSERMMEQQPPQSFRQRWQERPVDVVLAILAIGLILALTLWPFVNAFKP